MLHSADENVDSQKRLIMNLYYGSVRAIFEIPFTDPVPPLPVMLRFDTCE